MSVDVAIIGGGVSGLAAAVRLATAGATVALLDQAPKLGGRCYSFRDEATGDVVDNGQHVLVGAYRHTLGYLETIGSRRFLARMESIPFIEESAGRGFVRMRPLPSPFHLLSGLLGYRLLPIGERVRLLRVGLALRSLDAAPAERHPAGLTADAWLSRLGQSDLSRRFFWNPLCVSVMNEEPGRASALLFARALASTLLGPPENAHVLIPTIGQTELYVEPALRLLEKRGALVETGAEATGLELSGRRVTGVRLADGRVIKSDSVIAAVPPSSLQKLAPAAFAAAPPFDALGKFSASPIISIHLWFDRDAFALPFAGLIGRELQWVFNRRMLVGARGAPGSLSAVISAAYRSVGLAKEELVALALRDLRACLPESRGARLLASIVIKERRATFAPTLDAEELRPAAATPIERFYLAGDWTKTGYPATIEGAIMSGETAAALALRS